MRAKECALQPAGSGAPARSGRTLSWHVLRAARWIFACLLVLNSQFCVPDTITFSGNSLKTILAKGKERTVLSGNATLTSDDNFIRADTVELYGDDFAFVRCSGNVHVINTKKEIDVTSETMYYDRKQKIIRFRGNVVMEDKKNETIVKGGYVENWEDEEIVIIQLGVRILKKDMACRSEFARYFRKEERLELSGLPRVTRNEDTYAALKIYVNLENDEVTLEGNVSGEVKWEEEKSTESGKESKGEAQAGEEKPAPGQEKPVESGKEGEQAKEPAQTVPPGEGEK
jgi:lipopolysaccharide export system protein LptA